MNESEDANIDNKIIREVSTLLNERTAKKKKEQKEKFYEVIKKYERVIK